MAFEKMFIKKRWADSNYNTNVINQIRISINKNRYSRSGYNLKFSIGKNITKKLEWEYGDRDDLLWDEEVKIGKIVKQKEGQFRLIGDNNLCFTYWWEKGLPRPEYIMPLCDLKILRNEIKFSFPACCFNYLSKKLIFDER